MSINELIEQIGRERLDNLASGNAFYCIQDDEGQLMARALLAVLDAKPIGVVEELTDGLVLDGVVHTESRTMKSIKGLLAMKRQPVGTKFYTIHPAASEPVSNGYKLPDGYILVPIEPTWGMLSADGCSKHHDGQECSHHENRKRIWRAMIAAAPAPGGVDG